MTNQNAPEARSESSAWLGARLPIETAPRDGTEVLVLLDCASVAVVRPAWYRSRKEWEDFGRYFFGWDSLEEWEGWWSYASNGVGQEKLEGLQLPTHWYPMSALPSA
jgi:hypothetical protein